jgi:hypothetical protein
MDICACACAVFVEKGGGGGELERTGKGYGFLRSMCVCINIYQYLNAEGHGGRSADSGGLDLGIKFPTGNWGSGNGRKCIHRLKYYSVRI